MNIPLPATENQSYKRAAWVFDQHFLLNLSDYLVFFVFKFRKLLLSVTGADLITKSHLFFPQKR